MNECPGAEVLVTESLRVEPLKVKGSSSVVKMGTKVKRIRLITEGDHNIDCRVEGIGEMALKSEFLKKA